MLRVLHLAGSPTSDFYAEVSRLYAVGCLDALPGPPTYEHVVTWVEPGGAWRFPHDLSPAAVDAAAPVDLPEALRRIQALEVDVVVPQLFCLPGMTHYRALLDVLGLPYPGNPPAVMAIGADKALARAVVAAAGVEVPEGAVVRPGEPLPIGLPVVVKPVDADNSLGVGLVRDAAEFDDAVLSACEHADRALVERYVELGREVRCAVVDVGGELTCLPLEEYAVDPLTKPIRDHADKLRPDGPEDGPGDGTGLALVAKDAAHAWIVDPADPVCGPVHEAARLAYDALGCRGYGLFDFRIDPDGRPWFLEASLYCSYAPTSVVVVMAESAGIPLAELFELGVATVVPDRRRT